MKPSIDDLFRGSIVLKRPYASLEALKVQERIKVTQAECLDFTVTNLQYICTRSLDHLLVLWARSYLVW